jgi:hypothetical protein
MKKYPFVLFILLLASCVREEIGPSQLYWYQPRLIRREYELKLNNQTVADISWNRGRTFVATYTEAGRTVHFRKPNWLRNDISLEDAAGRRIGTLDPRGFFRNGYTLDLNGQRYVIRVRYQRLIMEDDRGNLVVELGRSDNRRQAVVGLPPTDNVLLAVLIYVKQWQDDIASSNVNPTIN